MAEERIEITIDETGKITAKTEGFTGETCLEELGKLLDSLDDMSEIKKTDEYYQSQLNSTKNQQKNKRS
jgi:hypothetical protein